MPNWWSAQREAVSPRNWLCPHCGERLFRRTSKRKSSLVREISYICDNFCCGATFVGFEEIVYQLKGPHPEVSNPNFYLPAWPGHGHLERLREGETPMKGVCPLCKSWLHTTCMPTKDPLVWALYVECSRDGCRWRASGPVAVAEENAESRAPKGETVRVNFEVDQAAHAKLKANAAKQGKTIRALLTAYAKSLLADKKP